MDISSHFEPVPLEVKEEIESSQPNSQAWDTKSSLVDDKSGKK